MIRRLVLVHGVNGQKLEKYYLLGTTILSLALNVPTMALHQFGYVRRRLLPLLV
jgi:hypothetical protein